MTTWEPPVIGFEGNKSNLHAKNPARFAARLVLQAV